MDFILEYWWQIAVYLIGCVLAYGRWSAIVSFYYIKRRNPIKWLICTLLSWIFFAVGLYFYYNPKQRYEKFFKWVPVLLLWCMVGCSSVQSRKFVDDQAALDTANNLRMLNDNYALPSIFHYDGCEYIVIGSGAHRMLAHKGNCHNSIHMYCQPINSSSK